VAKGSIDRRVARTRGLLHQALIALILRKGYEAITVADICEAADVGRSTFYAHYAGKEDLMRGGLAQLREALVDRHADGASEPAGAHRRSLGFSLPMFEHARDHLELYRAHVGDRGGAIAMDAIRRILSDAVRAELAPTGAGAARDGVPHALVVAGRAGAYMAVLTWWLDGGAKLSPERMDAMFRRLAAEGVPALAR
jgi:AcrR family transcriptional regulator